MYLLVDYTPVLTPKAEQKPPPELVAETWILREWKAGAQEGACQKRYLLDVDKNRKLGLKATPHFLLPYHHFNLFKRRDTGGSAKFLGSFQTNWSNFACQI